MPRRAAAERIDALYRRYSGQAVIPAAALQAKKDAISTFQERFGDTLPLILARPDLREEFTLTLTYTSNSIEGSTLTLAETAAVLFRNETVAHCSLVELLEAKNHQAALQKLFDHVSAGKPIDEAFVLKLDAILMNGIQPDAGRYRDHGVRIVGTNVPTANPVSVPRLIRELLGTAEAPNDDALGEAAAFHARFEKIHPFSDGNGRIGRIVMHAMLLRAGLPPAVIPAEQRRLYYAALQQAQLGSDGSLMEDFVCDAVLNGFRILDPPMR
jgi:Fic family protein